MRKCIKNQLCNRQIDTIELSELFNVWFRTGGSSIDDFRWEKKCNEVHGCVSRTYFNRIKIKILNWLMTKKLN